MFSWFAFAADWRLLFFAVIFNLGCQGLEPLENGAIGFKLYAFCF